MIYVQLYLNRNQRRVFCFLIFRADEFSTTLGHFRSFRICLITCSVTLYCEGRGFFNLFLSEIQKGSESLFTLGGTGVVPKAWGPLTAAHGENSAPRPEHLSHTAINCVVT